MQTTKTRSGSLVVPQKPSPATPCMGWKLKTPGSQSDTHSSMKSKTSKDRSPQVVDCRSPRSPAIEKKRQSEVSELEPQLAKLQDELKKARDQLCLSESWKRRAQQETEDSKKQIAAVSAKLEETQRQLKELSDSEEACVQELRRISQDRDRAWKSELQAVQMQHSMDSAALASALNEIQRLRIQMNSVSESEASQAHAEIQSLKLELTETLALVEKLKNQLNDSRTSEAEALEEVGKAQVLLEVVKNTEETLQLEHGNAMKSYEALLAELEESNNEVKSLEELVGNLQDDFANDSKISVDSSGGIHSLCENRECEQSEMLKSEIYNLKSEASQLRDALEDTERRYQEQCLQSTLQIRYTYEMVKHAESESYQREAKLEAKLKESQAEVEEVKTKLVEKENMLQSVPNETDRLHLYVEEKQSADKESEPTIELKKSESVLSDLKANLFEKETQLQSIAEENQMLKSEILKREIEINKANEEALASAEAARAAEREGLMKLGYLTEEADKSCREAARVTDELHAAQAATSEMKSELRRLKVQSDQWRKAAEAAAAMLSNGNNGKYVERTGSLGYYTIGEKLGLPYSGDMDDESPQKKNGNMLKKIGVLLKKGQK